MKRSSTSHWKDSQVSEGGLTPSRAARRWLATLVTLGLVGLLIWYLLPPDQVTTRLVPVSVAEFDENSLLPPIPFVEQDLAALVQLEGSRFSISSDAKKPLIGTTASNLLGHVRQQLQDALWTKDDVLVLYLLTHGLTLPPKDMSAEEAIDGGTSTAADAGAVKTVLADSGFRFAGGGVEIQAVLAAANECQARTKLVVMDASRIPSVPSEGMFVNELAHFVMEELQRKEGDEPIYGDDLWVLVAGGAFEPGLVDVEAGRSIFGRAFEEAIRCPPASQFDKNGDYQLSVGELWAAVKHQVGQRSPGQTVLLLRGGAGLIESGTTLAGSPVIVSTYRDVPQIDSGKTAEAATKVAAKEKDGPSPAQAPQPSPATAPVAEGAAPATPDTSASAPLAGNGPAISPAGNGGRETAATNIATEDASSGSASPTEIIGQATPPTAPPSSAGTPTPTAGAEAAPLASTAAPPAEQPRRPIFDRTGDEKKATQQRVRAELDRAWELNVYLTSRDTRGNWSPVDFAPLAWRESEARLIDLDRNHQLDLSDENQERTLARATAEVNRLAALAEAMDPNGPSDPATNSSGNELLDAWQHFWDSEEQRSWQEATSLIAFEPNDPAARPLREQMEAWRSAADLVYASCEYVALLDAGLACGITDTQARSLATTLKEYLTELTALCQQLRDGSGDSIVAREAMEAAKRGRQTLQDQARRFAGLVEAQQTTGAVPLAAAIAIRKARASREQPRSLPPGRDDEDPLPLKNDREAVFGTRPFQERLRDRAEIYALLAGLALLPEVDSSRLAGHVTVDEGPEAFLVSTRRMGRELAGAIARIAQSVAEGKGDALAAQRARLLDPHTIRSWQSRLRQSTFQAPPLPLPNRLFVAAVDEQGKNLNTLRLAADTAQMLPLVVRQYGSAAADVSLAFQFDGEAMTIRHAGQAITNGQSKPLVDLLGPSFTRRGTENVLTLEIQGRPASSGSEPESQLVISVQAPGSPHDVVVRCIRPLARPFLLTVDQEQGLPHTPSGVWSDPVALRPYPNRTTPFTFQLKNLSGAAKTVDVQLFAAQQDLKLFRQFWRERNPDVDIQQHLQELLGTSPLLVGEMKGLALAGQESKEVAFTKEKPQQPPEAEGGAAATGAEAAAPPAQGSDPPPDVANGMIAVVQDGNRQTHFFLEIEPKVPGSFLQPTAKIITRGGARILQIAISPLEDIPGLSDAPLIVRFSEDNPTLDERLNVLGRSEIASRSAQALLEFAIQRDEADWQVLLDVGSILGEAEAYYNRAFYLQIRDERQPNLAVNDVRDAQTAVQIHELAMGTDEATQTVFRGADALAKAQFSVARPRGAAAPTITVRFHADARTSAFTKYGDRVRLVARDDVLFEAHADRHITAEAVELGAGGLVLRTRAEDFQCQWRPGQSQAEVPLRLELALEEGGQAAHEVNVKLDAIPPAIIEFPDGTLQVTSAGAPQVELRARDGLTGISRVEVARSASRQAPFGDRDQLLETVNSKLVYDDASQMFRWQADLPADVAKPGETVRLVARVYDGVGHASEPAFAEVTIPRPQAPPPPPKGSIVGTASFNGTPTKAIVVELQGPDGLSQKKPLDAQRGFRFDNLPAGDYTITATGEVRLRVAGVKEVSGQVVVNQFNPRQRPRHPVTLKLE